MKMNNRDKKTAQDLIDAIKGKGATKPYDTSAEVVRVDSGIAWVHIPGGVDETPCEMTIACAAGDKVKVRVADGRCYTIGNSSKPPTDDTTAVKAKGVAVSADTKATNAQTTAEAANTKAEQALTHAKYFWHDAEGAHVSDTPRDMPQNEASSTLMTDSGMIVKKGSTQRASFGEIASIGDPSEAHTEIDSRALQVKQGNDTFFKAGVLNDENGLFQVSETTFRAGSDEGGHSIGHFALSRYASIVTNMKVYVVKNSGQRVLIKTNPKLGRTPGADIDIYLKNGIELIIDESPNPTLTSNVLIQAAEAAAPGTVPFIIEIVYKSDRLSTTLALGQNNELTNYTNIAFGNNNKLNKANSLAIGDMNITKGLSGYKEIGGALIVGYNNTSGGNGSFVVGKRSQAVGMSSAIGRELVATGENQLVIGRYNRLNTAAAFIIGNGTYYGQPYDEFVDNPQFNTRSNAFEVDWEGHVTSGATQTPSLTAGNYANILYSSVRYDGCSKLCFVNIQFKNTAAVAGGNAVSAGSIKSSFAPAAQSALAVSCNPNLSLTAFISSSGTVSVRNRGSAQIPTGTVINVTGVWYAPGRG